MLAVTGANVGGTEAALFPNFETQFFTTGNDDMTMTGGSNGDMGASFACGWNDTANALDPTRNSQTSREDGFDAAVASQWALGTKDYSGGSTVGMTTVDNCQVANVHIAQAATAGTNESIIVPTGPLR